MTIIFREDSEKHPRLKYIATKLFPLIKRQFCAVSNEGPIVFVVDDDDSVRRAVSRLLRSADFRPQTFATAEEFLAKSRGAVPDCILLDLQMPGLNGLELQRLLVAADRSVPIIFITGHGDIPTSVKAFKAGAIDFLCKPFDDQDLLTAIAEALNKTQMEQRERAEAAEIHRRLSTLTQREHEVLCHVVSGWLNKETAAALGTVEKTIKVHRSRVMRKLGASSLAQLVTMALRAGLVPLRGERT